jgi:enterochelin esterase-like enzyme
MGPTNGRRGAWCFVIVLLLSSSAEVIAQEPSAPPATSAVPGYRTEKRVLTSEALGEQRPYFVGLPESYSHDSDHRYPVIYVLDGLSHEARI